MLLTKVITRGLSLVQYVIENPICLVKRLKGVPLSMFCSLNQPWLKSLNIGTVIDVGANIGQFAKAIHEVFPNARIYSFEPLKDCYENLVKLKKRIPCLEAFNYAVGETAGIIEFYVSAFSPSSSVLKMDQLHIDVFPHTAQVKTIKVEMVRLDDMHDQFNIEGDLLLKIDVEGYEGKVLEGARRILDIAKVVIIEMSYKRLYEGQALFDDVYKCLISFGFVYAGNLSEVKSPFDGSVLQTDSVFIRP